MSQETEQVEQLEGPDDELEMLMGRIIDGEASPRDLKRPATFDSLITSLNHDKPLIRELARAHLYRLVPRGKTIAYDAASTPAVRMRAQTAWRKLIPRGKLPPGNES